MRQTSDRHRRLGACSRATDVGEEWAEAAEAAEATQGGASTSQAVEVAGTSTQADLPSTTIQSSLSFPSQQAFLDGLSSPGFQQMINDILLEGDGGYRPETQFGGSQVHLDLNELVSGPSHIFIALGGTPSSAAHVPGGSWKVPFMEPARLPTPPSSLAPAEQPDEPAACGWARRAPRRRDCGTGGHM
ncbi:hypothetical protein PIB30_017684 [Stylosanthes scabra]|uniref:Uncharacterized protein n=1 Tax=Stylosanthes scabra TaxID=79078 RepID=A0ABU6Z4B0_9FABA|nr:hypothetical protein [Stylosanthes scabra]